MKFGIVVPFFNQHAAYATILKIAKQTEALGFDTIWFPDHIVGPTPMGAERWLEVITLMSNVCAHVPRLEIGTDVLIAAYRHPVLAAKMITTLDIVSGGRLIVGVGGGYVEEEFAALGVPFAERGAYTDECIQVWKRMWSDDRVAFRGKYFVLDNVLSKPKPVQKPHPPILVGNQGSRVLRRAATLADGWHPIGLKLLVLE